MSLWRRELVDGKYDVKKVPVGTMKVQITSSKEIGKKKVYDKQGDLPFRHHVEVGLKVLTAPHPHHRVRLLQRANSELSCERSQIGG